jgi:uncharacterized protein (DUF885 family)
MAHRGIVPSNSRSSRLCCAAALWVLAGCAGAPPRPAPPPPGPSAADLAFERVSARFLNEMIPLTPVFATQLGDHRFDERLDDIGPTARGERAALARSLLADIASIDTAALSRANQVDLQLLKHRLEYTLWQLETLKEWRWNPLLYTDLAGNGIYLLMARDFAPLPVRLESAAARLEELPRLLAQVRETLDPQRVPRAYAETAIKQNAGVLVLVDELIEPQIAALPEADQARLRSAIERARTAVLQQQIWLEKRLLPSAAGDFRLGAALYDQKLHFELDSSLSRLEIRARAESELARTRAQMYEIARTVLGARPGAAPLPDAPTPDEQQAAIAAALEIVDADQPQRSQVLATAKRAFAEAERFVREKNLVTLYPDPLEIIPMPQFQRGVALAFCDAPGPLDRGLPTFYAVAPIPADWTEAQVHSYLREYNTRAIHELTIHEAMPGHFVQLAHAARYPSVLRAVLQSNTFIEGWAVYAERLMREQGYMQGDPLMQLIQLKWYLRSIANAILDQAVHVDGMSHEAAMRLMVHDTFQEQSEAEAKWVRVELTSAQLPTYFVGLEEHLALRDEALQRWGKSFTLERYDDTVLSYGSPPVKYVRALMFDLPIPTD